MRRRPGAPAPLIRSSIESYSSDLGSVSRFLWQKPWNLRLMDDGPPGC